MSSIFELPPAPLEEVYFLSPDKRRALGTFITTLAQLPSASPRRMSLITRTADGAGWRRTISYGDKRDPVRAVISAWQNASPPRGGMLPDDRHKGLEIITYEGGLTQLSYVDVSRGLAYGAESKTGKNKIGPWDSETGRFGANEACEVAVDAIARFAGMRLTLPESEQ